jgi:hypothetical protein
MIARSCSTVLEVERPINQCRGNTRKISVGFELTRVTVIEQ